MPLRRQFILFSIIFTFLMGNGSDFAYAAGKIKRLSEDNITEFIEKTADLTSGQNAEMSLSEVVAYFENHLDEDSHFKSTMQFNVPGYPAQKTSMSLDKKEFIANVQKGAQTVEGYENTITIKNIRISKDKTKATVETVGLEQGMMEVADETGQSQIVPIEGTSKCSQIIKLSDEGVIQMYNAKCDTTVSFKEY